LLKFTVIVTSSCKICFEFRIIGFKLFSTQNLLNFRKLCRLIFFLIIIILLINNISSFSFLTYLTIQIIINRLCLIVISSTLRLMIISLPKTILLINFRIISCEISRVINLIILMICHYNFFFIFC